MRSQRELAQMQYFNPEKFDVKVDPDGVRNEVDITYVVEEKSSDQIQLQGGWGAGRVVGSLGLSLACGIAQRNAARAAADQQYQSALIQNRSAEQAFANQQEALAAQLKETRANAAEDKFAKTIETLQAQGRIRASEQAGLTVQMLLQDQEGQLGIYRDSVDRTLSSYFRQYQRNRERLVSQRENRRNDLQSGINQAYNAIPSLGSILLNTAASGLNTYTQLVPV